MKERIEKLINETDLKDQDKEDVKALFEKLWYKYYLNGEDTHFADKDLKKFWLMYKIMMLCGMTTEHDIKGINLLTKELNANARYYNNEEVKIKEFV